LRGPLTFMSIGKGLLFVIIVAGVVVALPRTAVERFDDTSSEVSWRVEREFGTPPEERVDFVRRLMLYRAYTDFKEHPWFGLGYRGVAISTEQHYGISIASHGVAVISELGIVGTLLLLWPIVRFYRRASGVLTVSMTAVLFFGLTQQLIENPLFYVLLAMGHVAHRSPRAQAAVST
jgi:O-antigen ligase